MLPFFPDERSIPHTTEVRCFCRSHLGHHNPPPPRVSVFQQPTVNMDFGTRVPHYMDDSYGWRAADALGTSAILWIVGGRT